MARSTSNAGMRDVEGHGAEGEEAAWGGWGGVGGVGARSEGGA